MTPQEKAGLAASVVDDWITRRKGALLPGRDEMEELVCDALNRALPPDQPDAAVEPRIKDLLRRADPERGDQLVRWLELRLAVSRAEREVVEAAIADYQEYWSKANVTRGSGSPDTFTRMLQSVDRLRALREQAKAGECRENVEMGISHNAFEIVPRTATCNLPRGHEGTKHRGNLGEWEWE